MKFCLRGFKLFKYYRAFHRFGQAKFAYGCSGFRLEPIFTTAPPASKYDARFINQNLGYTVEFELEVSIFLLVSKTATENVTSQFLTYQ